MTPASLLSFYSSQGKNKVLYFLKLHLFVYGVVVVVYVCAHMCVCARAYMHTHMSAPCYSVHMAGRGQLEDVNSLLPPCG